LSNAVSKIGESCISMHFYYPKLVLYWSIV